MRHLLFVLGALIIYLLFWPTSVTPEPWTPPPAPSLEAGAYQTNDKLRSVQRLISGAGKGPEDIAIDSSGRVYAGFADGRVIAMSADGSRCEELGNTGGRPLGLALEPDGSVLIADAKKGLLRLHPGGEVELLSDSGEGIKIGFADDVARAANEIFYFTDASHKFGYGEHMKDLLEHGDNGRLLRYHRVSGNTDTLMAGLHFANGVALGPNDQYVLIAETSEYKITRYWLQGEKATLSEPFIENLPGFPDNLSFNGRDRFWVALYSVRSGLLDRILPGTFLRQVVARLPAFLQPGVSKHAFILGLNLDGEVVENYQFDSSSAYAPITSVEESKGWLYLGSLGAGAIGRIKLDELRSASPGSEPPAPVETSCTKT